jgi:protein transport protein SEC24
MAAPQENYPPQGYADQYGQQPQYNEQPQQPGVAAPPAAGYPEDVGGGKKKKRGYAAQAYDFGAGANSQLGGQPVAGAAAPFSPGQAPVYGGYGAQPEAQPAYGAQPAYAAPGMSPVPVQQPFGQTSPALGGYQAPEASYPAPGAPGVAGITQGMGQMGFGGAQPAAAPQSMSGRPAVLNQLYPTDLLNQPFNVAELDLPPPPIVLPPNVSVLAMFYIDIC